MQNIISISQKLNAIWKKVYIVWGWCREQILWIINENSDIDLATDATPTEMIGVLKVVKEVGKKYWTLIVKEGSDVFEITTFRKDIWILDNRKPVNVEFTTDLTLDSARRDLTINSIYYDVANKKFIDPQNWIFDLQNNIINFVWNPEERIKEDALRILRFIRFKNTYNLNSSFETLWIIKENIELLNKKDLKQIDFFKTLFPYIDNLENTPGWPGHHLEWNVWIHTLMALEQLNLVFKTWFEISNNSWINEIVYFDNNEKLDYIWTLLLHDISKFETYQKDEDWNVHYYNHEELWAVKFRNIANKFKFTNSSKSRIFYLIQNHLKVFKVFEMKQLKSKKFMMHKYFKDLMLIWICDHLWRIPATWEIVTYLKEFYQKFMIELQSKVFFTWHDIMQKYPDLKWQKIKDKLQTLNDNVLLWRMNNTKK